MCSSMRVMRDACGEYCDVRRPFGTVHTCSVTNRGDISGVNCFGVGVFGAEVPLGVSIPFIPFPWRPLFVEGLGRIVTPPDPVVIVRTLPRAQAVIQKKGVSVRLHKGGS